MKKSIKKLALNRETLRLLDSEKLGQVAGAAAGAGVTDYNTCCCQSCGATCTSNCPTVTETE